MPEKLQANFWVIDALKGKVVLKAYKSAEPWRVGLVEITGGFLLLHGYSGKPEMGLHRGFSVIDVSNGSLVFDFNDLTYKGLFSEKEALSTNILGHLVLVNLSTGERKSGFQDPAAMLATMQVFENRRNEDLILPVSYLSADNHYKLLQDFIHQKTGRKAVNTLEYAETENAIVLSFYVVENEVLVNYLMACSVAGEVLLQVCLQKQAAGIGMDTFFIFAKKLFFLEEKSVIAAYQL